MDGALSGRYNGCLAAGASQLDACGEAAEASTYDDGVKLHCRLVLLA